MKKLTVLTLVVFMLMGTFISPKLSVVSAQEATIDYEVTDTEEIDVPFVTLQTLDSIFGEEDGVPVSYTTATGNIDAGAPAIFNVVNMQTKEVIAYFLLDDAASSWAMSQTDNGDVYIATTNTKDGARLYRYSYEKGERSVQDLGKTISGMGTTFTLTTDGVRVYGGGHSTGKAFMYDPQTDLITDLGLIDNGNRDEEKLPNKGPEDYIRSSAVYKKDGKSKLYLGTGSKNGRVWEIDLDHLHETGEVKKKMLAIPHLEALGGKENNMQFVYNLSITRNYLFAFFNGAGMMVYDLDKEEWTDKFYDNVRGVMGASTEVDGHVYHSGKDKKLYRINLDTLERDPEPVMDYDANMRTTAVLNYEDEKYSKNTMVSVHFNGSYLYADMDAKEMTIEQSHAKSQPLSIQSLYYSKEFNRLYSSGYMGVKGYYHNVSDKTSGHFKMGQIEGMAELDGKMYFGEYPKASFLSLDMSLEHPGESENAVAVEKVFNLDSTQQDRPFRVFGHEGKLYTGTIPTYGAKGGALAVYDPKTEELKSYPNIIEGHSIVGLTVKDGIAYGSTSVSGGLGDAKAEGNAKVFMFDLEKEEVIKISDLDEIGGTIPMISGMEFNDKGQLFAVANGTIVELSPEDLSIIRSKTIYENVDNYGMWRPVYTYFVDDMIITNPGSNLTIIDTDTFASRPIENSEGKAIQAGVYTVGENYTIYFAENVSIKTLELTDVKVSAPSVDPTPEPQPKPDPKPEPKPQPEPEEKPESKPVENPDKDKKPEDTEKLPSTGMGLPITITFGSLIGAAGVAVIVYKNRMR